MSFKRMLAEADPETAAQAAIRMAQATVHRRNLSPEARAQAQHFLDLGVGELTARIRATRGGAVQSAQELGSIPAVLRRRAAEQPTDPAFTFVDYDRNPDGVETTLTWSALYQEVLALAARIRDHAEVGDRVCIVAPQSMAYIVSVLACFEANVIAVPVNQPIAGHRDLRVEAVIADAQPAVLLATSESAGAVKEYVGPQDNNGRPVVLLADETIGSAAIPWARPTDEVPPDCAYLQYTSGSTRVPVGVMVSQRNLIANFAQQVSALLSDYGGSAPPGSTVVSWLPFYHDMGLFLGIFAPILGGWQSVVMSPIAFLVRPARWMEQLSVRSNAITAAPNFALELVNHRTTDAELAALQLGDVVAIVCGSERVNPSTIERFSTRFAAANLPDRAIRPAYGLAEATLFVAAHDPVEPAASVTFDAELLASGTAGRSSSGTALISYGRPDPKGLRIVDVESKTEAPASAIGEIWIRGEHVCAGYWNKPEETEGTFRATLAGEPDGPVWLRTGDLGFLNEGQLFVVGRIKDSLLFMNRRRFAPDDIEAAIQEITHGRVAAVVVGEGSTVGLVAVIEVEPNKPLDSYDDLVSIVKMEIWERHWQSPADVVLTPKGSIPTTTSGKIRRFEVRERYEQGHLVRLGRAASR